MTDGPILLPPPADLERAREAQLELVEDYAALRAWSRRFRDLRDEMDATR